MPTGRRGPTSRLPTPFRAAPRPLKTFVSVACWRGSSGRLERKRRALPPGLKRLDGEQEAQVIALRLGSPPKGYANWSLRLLARRVVELGIVESLSHETVRRMLKKKRHDPAEDRVLGDPAGGRRRSSWRTWSRSWTSMRNRTTRLTRSCAWMSSRCNWSRKRARRWPPRWRGPAASTTSTRTGRHGLGLPVRRAAGVLAAGDGAAPADEGGLGGGGRRPVGGALRRLPEGHLRVGQPQHAHARRLLRGVPSRPGLGSWFVASSSATRRSTGAG